MCVVEISLEPADNCNDQGKEIQAKKQANAAIESASNLTLSCE